MCSQYTTVWPLSHRKKPFFLMMYFLAHLYISYIDGKKTGEKNLCGITQAEYKGGNYFNDLQMPSSFLNFWSRKGTLLGALNGKDDLL